MARFMDTGITYHEDDRGESSFVIRVDGSNEFVSEIDPDCPRSWPPGNVELVEGWGSPDALRFDSLETAIAAAIAVWEIEGFHVTVEPTNTERTATLLRPTA